MSFNENLATRVRRHLKRKAGYSERKMFRGLCFMLNGNMCSGVLNDDLIVRVKPDEYAAAFQRSHTRQFDFTGRPMKGFVVVQPKGTRPDKSFKNWIAMGIRCARSPPGKTARKKAAQKIAGISLYLSLRHSRSLPFTRSRRHQHSTSLEGRRDHALIQH